MQFYSRRVAVAFILSVLCASSMGLAPIKAYAQTLIAPEAPKTHAEQPTTPLNVEEASLQEFLDTINHLKWTDDLPHDKEFSLLEALNSTQAHNWDIKVAQQKIEETEAKQDGVESKRILFFFKYFDARYLEGSAESDVQAQQEHTRSVEQTVLKQTVNLYGKALEAALGNKVAFWQVKQAYMQRKLDYHQFETGKVTAFTLNNSTQSLYTHYQNYLHTLGLWSQAAHALALHTTGKGQQAIIPAELKGDPSQVPLLKLPLFKASNALVLVSKPDASQWKRYALTHRPDYRELFYRHESVDKLKTASKLQFDHQQTRLIEANLKSLQLRMDQLEELIEAEIENTILALQTSKQQLHIAQQQQALAKLSLHQANVSHKAGFSSDKDLLDAELVYHASQLQYTKAQLGHFQSQVNAFATLGDFTISQLEH